MFPAAGNRNDSSLNNAGSNGNYWSSSPYDSNNAYNLNFNSSEYKVDWNNRNNGYSVRAVSELTNKRIMNRRVRHFSISKEQLLIDLLRAYKDARKNKRGRAYQLKFEFNLEDNLILLRDELINCSYKPQSSNCFVIHEPKMREVFAANFRDRIVHHLFYNYTHTLFERTFIYDSYSCIKKRGTHFGIKRLQHHILSESKGYSKECYVLKIDIKGYFMNINRNILLELCRNSLAKMQMHKSYVEGKTWGELLDYEFIDYLLEVIISTNPVCDCNILGNMSDWDNLPKSKSLFFSKESCGLPIGNLSSQLFSNIYMNIFDQYVKRDLKCKHYGRYVDDAYIVSADKEELKKLVPQISEFLNKKLGLNLNVNKVKILNVKFGIEFLGSYIKPFRIYISSSVLNRIKSKLRYIKTHDKKYILASVNSYLGVLSHYNSFYIRRVLFGYILELVNYGSFDEYWLKFREYIEPRPQEKSIKSK